MVKHVFEGFLQVFCKQYSQLCHCHSLSVPARSCDQMIFALCIFFPHQPPLRQRLPLQHNTYFPFQPHVFGQNLPCAFNEKQQDAQIYSYSTVVVFSQPINISPALLAFLTYSWPQVLYQTVPVSICLLSFWALLLQAQIASYHLLSWFDFMHPKSLSSQLCILIHM